MNMKCHLINAILECKCDRGFEVREEAPQVFSNTNNTSDIQICEGRKFFNSILTIRLHGSMVSMKILSLKMGVFEPG